MTAEELLALPVVVNLETANRALGIGRSTGYALARAGEYPVKVLRVGNAYRVPTAELLKLLGLVRPQANSRDGAAGARAEKHALVA
jgi:hypothetical protein